MYARSLLFLSFAFFAIAAPASKFGPDAQIIPEPLSIAGPITITAKIINVRTKEEKKSVMEAINTAFGQAKELASAVANPPTPPLECETQPVHPKTQPVYPKILPWAATISPIKEFYKKASSFKLSVLVDVDLVQENGATPDIIFNYVGKKGINTIPDSISVTEDILNRVKDYSKAIKEPLKATSDIHSQGKPHDSISITKDILNRVKDCGKALKGLLEATSDIHSQEKPQLAHEIMLAFLKLSKMNQGLPEMTENISNLNKCKKLDDYCKGRNPWNYVYAGTEMVIVHSFWNLERIRQLKGASTPIQEFVKEIEAVKKVWEAEARST